MMERFFHRKKYCRFARTVNIANGGVKTRGVARRYAHAQILVDIAGKIVGKQFAVIVHIVKLRCTAYVVNAEHIA